MFTLETVFYAIDQRACADYAQHGTVDHGAVIVTDQGCLDHPLKWADQIGKSQQLAALGARIRSVRALRYGIMGEGWLKDDVGDDGNLPPSKSDTRQEGIFIVAVERGLVLFGTRAIFRDVSGARLGELRCHDSIGGPMTELMGAR